MLQRVLQRCNQSLILREIVGLVAKVFAKGGDFSSGLIFDHYTIACRPRIAARTAITVSDQIVRRRIVMRFEKTAGVRHWHCESLISLCSSVRSVVKNHSQSECTRAITARQRAAWRAEAGVSPRRCDLALLSGCKECGGSELRSLRCHTGQTRGARFRPAAALPIPD